MRAAPAALAIAVVAAGLASAQTDGEQRAAAILAPVTRNLADYYARARTIVSRETVRLQPLDRQLQPSREWRQLVYDVRVDWDPSKPGEPTVTRELISAGGRLDTLTSRDSECFDLNAVSDEPLAMLLPGRRERYAFKAAGGRESKAVSVLEFSQTPSGPLAVTWRGRCGSIEINGNTVGRVWVDTTKGVVVRIDERLPRPFSYVMPLDAIAARHPISQTIDRLETSIKYEPVTFRDPDETVMLPASIRTLAVIHNSGMPQLLTLQTYSNYRRFTTGGRVVK